MLAVVVPYQDDPNGSFDWCASLYAFIIMIAAAMLIALAIRCIIGITYRRRYKTLTDVDENDHGKADIRNG